MDEQTAWILIGTTDAQLRVALLRLLEQYLIEEIAEKTNKSVDVLNALLEGRKRQSRETIASYLGKYHEHCITDTESHSLSG